MVNLVSESCVNDMLLMHGALHHQIISSFNIKYVGQTGHCNPWRILSPSGISVLKNNTEYKLINMFLLKGIWVRSRNCGCLVTWFCYQLIAKPGSKAVPVSWPGPYVKDLYNNIQCTKIALCMIATKEMHGITQTLPMHVESIFEKHYNEVSLLCNHH